VNRRFSVGRIEAALQCFSVDRHDLTVADLAQRGDTTQQALFELGKPDRREDRIEPVVRRNAAAQVERIRHRRFQHLAGFASNSPF